MSRTAPPRFRPRSDSAALSLGDLHFLIHADGRIWWTVATRISLKQRAAYLVRRRLVHQGYLEPTPHTQPMKWTHATLDLIDRAATFGPINLPARADQHRQGRPLGGKLSMSMVDAGNEN